ncbi:MAG TPA: SEC-C metal-binding domain-containing protein [Candidatus Dormibacteraeota bacterium]|nr:SEC-C metal-binding domain-containing protein [Candidatus Dormibacteraeota bacterium]
MTKKKAPSGKPSRVKAATGANPVRPDEVAQAPKPPKPVAASSATPTPEAANARLARPAQLASAGRPVRRPQSLNFAGVGRNDICPCGSGKRFKNCHGH